MTITRKQLQDLRDAARKDATGHAGDIDRHLNKLATEADAMDAVLARAGSDTIYAGGPEPAPTTKP